MLHCELSSQDFIQLQLMSQQGQWVLLQNGHNARALLNSLETIFADKDSVDSQFRCWITACADPHKIPVHVLHKCIKVMVDSPKVGVINAH